MITRTMEEMAIAVLRGDIVAARALADILTNDVGDIQTKIIKKEKLTVNGNLKVLVFVNAEVEMTNHQQFVDELNSWLHAPGPAILNVQGVHRIEFYEVKSGEIQAGKS